MGRFPQTAVIVTFAVTAGPACHGIVDCRPSASVAAQLEQNGSVLERRRNERLCKQQERWFSPSNRGRMTEASGRISPQLGNFSLV
jgi:hypothetical protein